jgi:putative ABC transport system permease protein
MTRALKKNIRRSITGSLGRYIAIMLIIMLGVGFFAGLRLTHPSMSKVQQNYLIETQLYDLRLLSTIGFDEEDVDAIAACDGVTAAVGSTYADFILQRGDAELVYRAHAITDDVNLPDITAGRMPEADNECLLDANRFTEDMIGQTIDLAQCNDEDTLSNFKYTTYTVTGLARSPLYLSADRGTTSLGNGSLTGFVLIPMGGFDTEYFTEVFVKCTDEFAPYSDEYNDYVDTLSDVVEQGATLSVEARFDDLVADAQQELDDARQELEDGRADGQQELDDAKAELDDALAELQDGQTELDDAKAELVSGQQELDDAKSQLDEAKAQLDEGAEALQAGFTSWEGALESGRKSVADGQSQLDAAISSGKATLADSKAQLDTLEKTYSSGLAQWQEGSDALESYKAQWQAGNDQYEGYLTQWQEGYDQYESYLAQWNAGNDQYQAALAAYNENEAAYEAGLEQYQQAQAAFSYAHSMGLLTEEEEIAQGAALEQTRLTLEQTASALSAGKAQLDATGAELESQKAQLDATEAELTAQKAQLDASGEELTAQKAQLEDSAAQLAASKAQLDTLRSSLDDGWVKYNAGIKEMNAQQSTQQATLDSATAQLDQFQSGMEAYYSGLSDYEDGLKTLADGQQDYDDGVQTLADGWDEYNDGLAEYEDGLVTFQQEIDDGEQKIADAQAELDDLSEPKLYVLSRGFSNAGYATFESDSQIVNRLAGVFPIFFFLIAALVCSTTMTRMVDDDRTQIGTMRALGYSRNAIIGKYVIYSGSAAILGCLIGYFGGGYLFPLVIWTAYQMLYKIPGYCYVFDLKLLILSLAAALLCSVGVTYLACRRAMAETPADLIRPKTPAAGKRIWLEKITFLWKRLKFLHKVTMRNIFRFKKRMFMMILGIAGCTALVVTGFGIYDSVADIANYQYDQIQKYDISILCDDGIDSEWLADSLDTYGDQLDAHAAALTASGELTGPSATKNVYFVVSDDPDITQIIDLHRDGETVPFPEKGQVVITEKLASMTGVEIGDTVTISVSDTDKAELTVSGIAENYVYNYVYMTGETYDQAFQDDFQENTLLLRTASDADEYTVAAALSKDSSVSSVTVVTDTRNTIDNMMKSLNYVVALVLGCAAALAFIVLFNLGNINLSERVREIATIKVLGFHSNETGAYVFRENIILSLMGIVCGLPLGTLLHAFVMSQIQVDMVSFKTIIKPLSYLLSVLMVTLFTVITDQIMRRKIARIDMAESLKSIE